MSAFIASYSSIMVDGFDNSLEEDFMGLAPLTASLSISLASALLQVIKNLILRCNLSISKLRGQCYDGAASMYGTN